MLETDWSEQAVVSADPVIRCVVDRRVRASRVDGRLDLHLMGRVVSSSPLRDVALRDETGRRCRIISGGYQPRTECGFHFILAYLQETAPQRRALELVARTRDGRAHYERLTLLVEPDGVIAIDGRPVSDVAACDAGPAGVGALPPIHVYAEYATLAPSGELAVSGWAVSLTPVVAVLILGGEQRIGFARLALPRDDVAGVHPFYPNAARSGFAFSGFAEADLGGVERITVQTLAVDGVLYEVDVPIHCTGRPAAVAHTETAAEQQIHLHLDEVTLSDSGTLDAHGWVVCEVGVGPVTVTLDGIDLGAAQLGLERPDVGRRFPHLPFARLGGFRCRHEGLPLAPGEQHVLRVATRNGLKQPAELVRSVTVTSAMEAPPATRETEDFRLELDTPRVTEGVALEPVTTRLSIGGWALARSGVQHIRVVIDGEPAGGAHHGSPRPDVAAALPDWPDALHSGYIFNCPPRLLKEGRHEAVVTVVSRQGNEYATRFTFTVRKPADAEELLGIRRHYPRAEQDLQMDLLSRLAWRPEFQLLLPVREAAELSEIDATLDGLLRQGWADWRLLLLTGSEVCAALGRAWLQDAAPERAIRMQIVGPGAALDRAFEAARPATLFALIGPGDRLGADALVEMAVASGLDRSAELFYCDEVRRSPASGEREPFFKPGWSPHLLLSANYVGRFWCARPELLLRVGVTARQLLDDGEYDLVLRCTEAAHGIHHLARLLCQRGPVEEPEASERAALASAATRRRLPVSVVPGRLPHSYRLRRTEPVPGLVSVIIPTCASQERVRRCIETVRASVEAGRVEIICIENIPPARAQWREWLTENVDRIVSTDGAFNWSRFNNLAARKASGEFLLFLNDDVEITRLDWLDAMLEQAALPGVGVVGPQLLYPDGRVQHAGMFLSRPGLARHAFRLAAAEQPGYFGLALTTRNVIAVTGACLMVRRALFERLGGFDEAHEIINNDLDFCLRVHEAGYATVYTPHASLLHHERASRDGLPEAFNSDRFERRWQRIFFHGDPFFNPHLSRNLDEYAPEEEPTQRVCAGHPLFARDEIRRILAVKLDHIGDFLTAVPALHRLRALFPAAQITLLGSQGIRDLALATGGIADFVDFEFFHARSGLGQRDLAPQDLAVLQARLAPERFDLAIDLRKHLDTREVLQATGARYLVGFDQLGRFPWLDVALEWEGDRAMQAKRGHVGDDLVNLVEAVATASQPDRNVLVPLPPRRGRSLRFLSRRARRFFDRPVVCVHPGVGNVMRQWPIEHYLRLVERLTVEAGTRVLLIGARDERELGERIVAGVSDPASVLSVVGETSLADLPALLAACVLFVGNNSGPKHIAAACGVPTVGIHSGVVDASEWAPVGPRAVVVRRSMACSPCYLARAEDCHRDLACLHGLEPAAVYAVCERLLAGAGVGPAVSAPC